MIKKVLPYPEVYKEVLKYIYGGFSFVSVNRNDYIHRGKITEQNLVSILYLSFYNHKTITEQTLKFRVIFY